MICNISVEYTSQSNDSGQCVQTEDRYKFVDDLSLLELLIQSQLD